MIPWLALAHAAEPAPISMIRSETAVDAAPDVLGQPAFSTAQRLVVEDALSRRWSLGADGGIRQPPAGPLRADLWQLQLRYETAVHRVVVGRQHRLDPRGFLQLDGATVEADDGGELGVSAWAGRLWDAEIWRIDEVWVGGTGVTHRPSRALTLDTGAELRSVAGDLQPRLYGAASTDSVRGDRLWGVVETSDDALNTRVDGTWAATRRWDLGAGVRWEGLAPSRGPRTPYELLAGDGYGIGELRASWRKGAVVLTGAGGPTWATSTPGASGRLSAGVGTGRSSAAVFTRAAGIGGSAFAGGGVELRPVPTWVLDAAWYGLQPLDGDAGGLWEARVRGTTRGADLGVAVDAAVFGNATLRTGLRAGLLLRAGAPPVPGTGGRP